MALLSVEIVVLVIACRGRKPQVDIDACCLQICSENSVFAY